MSEISNAFEHFIVLLMKSDSHFLNKGDSCVSTNSTCMYILTIVLIYIHVAQLIQRPDFNTEIALRVSLTSFYSYAVVT